MRNLLPSSGTLPAVNALKLCTIPKTLLENGQGRLLRVDTFLAHGKIEQLTDIQLLKIRRLVNYLLQHGLVRGYMPSSFPGIKIHSSGTYDGMAIEVVDIDQVPYLPHVSMYHIISLKLTQFVYKLAIIGPAVFHPVCVSNNIPVLSITTKTPLAAIFSGTMSYCS